MATADIHKIENTHLPQEVCEEQSKALIEALSAFKAGQSANQLREYFDDLSKRCAGSGQLTQAEELLKSFEGQK